jgi:hypothetical protein
MTLYSYTQWNTENVDFADYIEVSLPVIQWDDYLRLSKIN